MSTSGKSRKPLVAEKRYSKVKSKAKKPATKRKRAPRKRATKKPIKRSLIGWILLPFTYVLRIIWAVTWRITATVVLAIAAWVGYTTTTIPELPDMIDGRTRGSITFLDREGVVFAWRGDQYGGPVASTAVAPALKNAVVATEDKRFFRHIGISPRGIASAMRINMREGRGPLSGNGGSTITQQTAKLLCIGVPFDPKTWKSESEYEADCRRTTKLRKVKEAIYAMAMEAKFSKDEILTIYFNRAYLGGGARGFEAASQLYFDRPAAQVSTAQAAMLAGLLKAPSSYSPTSSLQRAQDRAATVLKLMREQSYITIAQEQQAREEPATLAGVSKARIGGYFVDWAMGNALHGLGTDTTEDVVMKTTFDATIQKAAEEAVQHIYDTKISSSSVAQTAVVVMSADGAVRAMIGGRDLRAQGAFNRAVQAKRQTGSAFKPFVYAAAMDRGFQYDSILDDEPFTINVPGSGPYSPKNYSRDYKGTMTLTDALAQSINTIAVQVSEEIGRSNVRDVAYEFGINDDLANGPALALGASESTLIDMTGAFAGIMNGGLSVTPYGITELRLKSDASPINSQEDGYGDRVISQSAAEQLTYMMSRVVTSGTGKNARIEGREVAGKTGTTQAAKDAWFIGFTAQYAVGVWIGNDDNTPLRGTTGGGLPAHIWRETVNRISSDLPNEPLNMIRPATPPTVKVRRPVANTTTANSNRVPSRQPDTSSGGIERTINRLISNIFGGGN
ncbi:MAG: transglycosylase domain-containing protein [Litoreibacter sp.]